MSSKKRFHSHFDNGKHKRHSFGYEEGEKGTKAVDTMYRILCPVKKIGSVLGKGGTIVNALRDETHAKIRVADAIPGAEERVIIIYSYSEEPGTHDSDLESENSDLVGDESEQLKPHCPAQDALLKVHDRIAADELLHGSKEHNNKDDDETVTTRILVPKNQVGCLLGKGGHIIQRLRSDTRASIRILPTEELPPCAMSTDELVQISGVSSVARRALYEVSTLLYQHPHKENPPLDDVIYASTQGSYPPPGAPIPHAPPVPWYGGSQDESRFVPGGFGGGHMGRGEKPEEFSMRIVCTAGKIGGVIGKGGANVKQLQQETGAKIQVEDTSDDERVIVVSSREVLSDPVSPTIEAILQLQSKTCEASDKGITLRLLVPSSKVGCLLGQGGHIVNEMRRRTKADIRIYSKNDKPKYTSPNEELVQITGSQNVARDALSEIANRLRERTLQGGNPGDKESQVHSSSFYTHPLSDEDFIGRGLPASTVTRGGSFGSYDYLKGPQKLEGESYTSAPIHTGYSSYDFSDIKAPICGRPSILAKDGSYLSGISQITGASSRLYDPLSSANADYSFEMRGSSTRWNDSQSLSQSYAASGRQSLMPSGQHLQSAQGRYPYPY